MAVWVVWEDTRLLTTRLQLAMEATAEALLTIMETLHVDGEAITVIKVVNGVANFPDYGRFHRFYSSFFFMFCLWLYIFFFAFAFAFALT